MRILYVEDNEDNIYMLRARLARAGYTVIVATDGAQGVAMAASERPDLVLMDLTLPVLDGWEAARRIKAAPETRVLRDPTRGGLASALNELAAASRVRVEIDERRVPVRPAVRGACELLGLDPLYVACEGRLVAVVPPGQADAALAALRSQPAGAAAESIGEVLTADASTGPIVSVRSKVGGTRVVPLLAGEQLPRIC